MKTLMVSFQPKWARMILSGEKQYEFRQGNFVNAKTGDKFLILESLGKRLSRKEYEDRIQYALNFSEKEYYEIIDVHTEGTGKVIGEFIVGEVCKVHKYSSTHDEPPYIDFKTIKNELYTTFYWTEFEDLEKIGYDNQPLAFEITKLKIYDTPRDKSEFIIESKIKKRLELYNKNTDDIFTLKSAITNMGIPKDCFVTRSPQSFCRVIDTI